MAALQKLDAPNQDDQATLLQVISRAASDDSISIEKMERLFAMHERMEAKQAEGEFHAAMSRVQAGMSRIAADKHNSQTRSDYPSYAALDRVLRPLYTEAGLSISFDTESVGEGMVGMICHVSHTGGHTRTYRAAVPSDGKGAKGGDVMTKTHAFGSGTSYGMRYLLKMIFNVAIGEDPEDDDGNAAGDEVDVTAWFDAIADAASMDDLNAMANELKTAGLTGRPLRNVRAKWAQRAKELQA